jgi:predicted ATPase/DNA-binding SARP family transcriptional activator
MQGGSQWVVDVLGPIRVRDASGRDITPDGALQRRLLALLVLHRGKTVSADAAIEALWPSRPPKDPTAALQTHVFRLRGALPGLIDSTAAGYRLDPTRVSVDVDRLPELLHAPAGASHGLDDLLARWQGAAYPELADTDDGRAEAARLDDLRIAAREATAEARLQAGRADGLVADLAALADEHPLRERPRALLMAALAAEGRVVEALRTYDDFRRLLADELGIEPSPELAARHRQLLGLGELGGLGDLEESPWAPASRLPAAVTSIIGRDELAAEATALVDEHRLVTLVGPGGVGKTRLLLELGRRLRAARPDRPVVLCELAAGSAESAVDEVAHALAIDGRPGVGLVERLATVLADVEVVLLLDNCEHVLEPVAHLVDRLLAGCPDVTVVATSRERLRVAGEQLCAVPPLAFGATDDPAVELFVERARAVSPGFEPTAREQERIGEIVRRLDGLPLAIELAAARLHTLEVGEVAAGLDRRFRLLSGGSRTATRHGSLHAAVAWSVGLLDAGLRAAFMDLCVFAGPFSAADAAAVCDLAFDDAAEVLIRLSERSLVLRAPDRRFVLLETLREFGHELLEDEGDARGARARHAHHVVGRVVEADRELIEPGNEALLVAIEERLPEARSALGWLLDHGELGPAGDLVIALGDFAFLRLRPDVFAWTERVTAADPDDAGPRAAEVWAVSALAAWMAGDVVETGRRADRARAVAGSAAASSAIVLRAQGSSALFEGRLDDAVSFYDASFAAAGSDRACRVMALASALLARAYRADPDTPQAAAAVLQEVAGLEGPHAAYAWYCAGESDLRIDPERARERLVRALDLADRSHAAFVGGVAGASRASIEAREGDPAVAAEEYKRLVTHWQRAGMWSTQWTMLRSIALLLERLGRHREAAVLTGSIRSTSEGHRIFGDDAVALTQLEDRLRTELGEDAWASATAEGAALDGRGAAEHARRSL